VFDHMALHGIIPPICTPLTPKGIRQLPFRAFTGSELIVDSCLHMGAHGVADPLHSFTPAEEERVAAVMRHHGFL